MCELRTVPKGERDRKGRRTAAATAAGRRRAVDCVRPALEVHSCAHVRLDLWVEADQLFVEKGGGTSSDGLSFTLCGNRTLRSSMNTLSTISF